MKIKEGDYFLTTELNGRYPKLKRFRIMSINLDATIFYSTVKSNITELVELSELQYLLKKGHIKKTNEDEYWDDKYKNSEY